MTEADVYGKINIMKAYGQKRRKTKMKNFRKILALLLAVMMIALSCLFVACGEKEVEKKYSITVIVVNDKAEEKTFNIKTDRENLADALLDEKLVSGSDSEWGLMIDTVDGLKADFAANKSWWALYDGDKMSEVGASSLQLKDGGVYKFVYTIG